MIKATTSFSGIAVNNLSVARDFYVGKLGLQAVDEKMGLTLELPGGARLFIYEKPDHQPASFTVLNFVVEDIDDTVASLQADGVAFEWYDLGNGATQDENGILRGLAAKMGPDIAWFKDPAENILAVLQPA